MYAYIFNDISESEDEIIFADWGSGRTNWEPRGAGRLTTRWRYDTCRPIVVGRLARLIATLSRQTTWPHFASCFLILGSHIYLKYKDTAPKTGVLRIVENYKQILLIYSGLRLFDLCTKRRNLFGDCICKGVIEV